MSIIGEILLNNQEKIGISFTSDMIERFEIYAELLVEWNKKMNLTAITKPEEIAIKHYIDSLMILKYHPITNKIRLADVGSGAGFPGIPLLIVRPDIEMTMIDSLNKRLNFLNTVLNELGLNARLVHLRGEDAGRQKEYRQQFDIVTARAVAHMRELSEYTLPLLKLGGTMISMKGPQIKKEIEESKKAINMMGGKISKIETYEIEKAGERSLILIKKISQTPIVYPRSSAKIAKFPLN